MYGEPPTILYKFVDSVTVACTGKPHITRLPLYTDAWLTQYRCYTHTTMSYGPQRGQRNDIKIVKMMHNQCLSMYIAICLQPVCKNNTWYSHTSICTKHLVVR